MSVNILGLEGRVKGSIYNVVFYMRCGFQVCRSKAHHISNPRSQLQQLNRLNVANCVRAYKSLKPVLKKSLNNRPQNRKPYHQFLAQNLSNSFKDGLFYPLNFNPSGRIFESDIFGFTYYPGQTDNIVFSWLPFSVNSKQLSDKLILIDYNHSSNQFSFIDTNLNRSAELFQYYLKNNSPGTKHYFYLFFVKSDFSDSGITSIIEFTTP
jgi:hypothetical protein